MNSMFASNPGMIRGLKPPRNQKASVEVIK